MRTMDVLAAAAVAACLAAGCGRQEAGGGGGGGATRAEATGATEARGAPAAAAGVEEVATPSGLVMIRVPAGEFTMGDDRGADDEKPAHKVKVDAFLVDKFEVTQKAYMALAGKNPSKFKGENNPADQVSWYDAVKFCNLRSLREGLTPCYDEKTLKCNFAADGYRLPTEAEWEYACRAGTASAYSFGDGAAGLAAHGWSKENAGKTTHPVGEKPANPWGVCDMHGNVAEWCNDFYAEDAYKTAQGANPTGPAAGDECVLRGGSWNKSADACRSAARASETPRFADACFGADNYGFRCVRRPRRASKRGAS